MPASLAGMNTRVDPAERLLDLVIALSHTTRRMTKAQIRASVHGYEQAASDEAFERMFERDKVALRAIGVPIVTQVDDAHADDVGYRIDAAGYELPAIDLTAQEAGLLALAAQVWQDAELASAARSAITKLRAVGPAPDAGGQVGLTLRVRPPETSFAPLLSAIQQRRAVRFRYRAAGSGREQEREVEPWRLLCQDRAWYLRGHDRARGAERSFRLARITSRVRAVGSADAYSIPAADADSGAYEVADRTALARLALRPERAAALRARAVGIVDASGHRDIVTVPVADVETLAEELAGYADAVLVLDPAVLRDAVLRRLRAAAALDGRDG